MYWPNFTIHKCKQRVTKITQYLIKMRRIKLRQEFVLLTSLSWSRTDCFDVGRPKLIGVKKKLDRREATRERKALSAAHLEKSIQKELIERLKSKAYGDAPLNVNESVWQAILDREKGGKEKEVQGDLGLDMVDDETDGEDEEEELEEEFEGEFVSDISGDEAELSDLSDLEDIAVSSATAFIRLHPSVSHRMRDHLRRIAKVRMRMILQKIARSQSQKSSWASGKEKPRQKHLLARNRRDQRVRSFYLSFISLVMLNHLTEGPRVEVEYEHELESIPITRSSLLNW